jgi:hypothetical protein
MSSSAPKITWPAAIAEAGKVGGMSIPEPTQRGMGSVIWRNSAGDRFVSFRPHLGIPPNPENARARWSLWCEENDRPCSVLTFSLPLRPEPQSTFQVASVLQGWLIELWSNQAAQQHVANFANVEIPQIVPEPVACEYWLCENQRFGIVLARNGWEIRSGGRSLSTWKSKADESRGRLLSTVQLNHLCEWLARNWLAIA